MFDEESKERIARAICEACDENPDFRGDCRGNEFRWMDYLPVANAAIDAVLAEQARQATVWIQSNHLAKVLGGEDFLCRISARQLQPDFRPLYAAPVVQPCYCGEQNTSGVIHRTDGPCYVAVRNKILAIEDDS